MRSPVSGDLLLSLAALSIPARSPFSVIFSCSPSGSSTMPREHHADLKLVDNFR